MTRFVVQLTQKNGSRMGSIPLNTHQDVYNWIKRAPFPSNRTQAKFTDLQTGKTEITTKGQLRLKVSPYIKGW